MVSAKKTTLGARTRAVAAAPDVTSPEQSFVEFMRSSPLVGMRLNIRRSRSTTRRIRL